MKYYSVILTVIFAILLMSPISGQAERYRGRGGAHAGGWSGNGWGPLVGFGLGVGVWELSRPHHYPYRYYRYEEREPIIILQQPQDVYVQPAPQFVPAPRTPEPAYWYYCQDPQGYYPYVKQCAKGWMKVVPTP